MSKISMSSRNFVAFLVAAAILTTAPAVTEAASLYWYGNTTVLGGSGTWTDGSGNNWSTSPTASGNQTWVNANSDTAIFAGQYVGLPVVTLSSNITAGGLTFNYGGYTIAPGVGPYTLTLAGTGTINTVQGMTTFNGTLADTAGSGLIKSGAGMLYLNGDNSGITGTVSLNAGYLKVDTNANALGSGNLVLNSGTLVLANTTDMAYNRNTTIGGSTTILLDPRGMTANTSVVSTMGTLAIGSSTLTLFGGGAFSGNATRNAGVTFGATTLSGDPVFNVRSRNTSGNTFLTLGAVDGTGNLTATGSGNVTFASTISTGTGAITVAEGTTTFADVVSSTGTFQVNNNGTAVLSSNISSIGSTDVQLIGGTLQIATGINQVLVPKFTGNASTTLTLAGGRIQIAQPSNTTNQTLGQLNLLPGHNIFTATGGASGAYRLVFDSIGSRAIGSTMSFTNSSAIPVRFSNIAPSLTNGIIGGWAVRGLGWATVSGTGVDLTTAAFDSTDINAAADTANVSQSLLSGLVTLSNNSTRNSLMLTGNAVAGNTLDLGGKTLTLTTGGLMGNFSIASSRITITNGNLTVDTGVGSELFLQAVNNGNNGHSFNIGARITDNGTAVNLVRGSDIGGAAAYLSGVNTYTGKTYVGCSVASLAAGNSGLFLMTERQLGVLPTPGSAAVADKVTLNNANIQFNNNVPFSWAPERGITLGGAGGQIYPGSYGLRTILSANITGTGLFSFSAGNTDTTLSGSSTFDGPIYAGGGNSACNFISIGNIGDPTPTALGTPTNAANGLLRQATPGSIGGDGNNMSWVYVGAGPATTDRSFEFNNSSNGSIGASGTGPLTINGNIYLDAATTVGYNMIGTGLGIMNGNIIQTGSGDTRMTKTGTGTWRLTGQNTYAGITTAGGGVLEFTTVGNVGSGPSSLGAPTTTANATLTLSGGGLLRFIGATNQSTDRNVSVTTVTSLDASGTGGATLTLLGNVTSTSATTLTLMGLGNGYISGATAGTTGLNNSGANAFAITKDGPGTWTINTVNANTYTGVTTLRGGTLVLDYSRMATATNLIPATNTMTFGANFGGGTLSIIAKPTGLTSQTLGAITFPQDGGGSKIALNTNGGSGLTLAMGAAALTAYGRTTNFTGFVTGQPSGNTTVTSSGTGFGTLVNGLYPFATINNTEFATATTSNTVLAIYSGYTGALPTGATAVASSYTLAADQTQTALLAFTGLKIGPINSAGQGLHLGTFAMTPNGTSGIIFDGTGTDGYTIDGTTGLVMTGINIAVHVAGNQPLTIAAPIVFNGNTYALTKGGEGTLILSGNNTFGNITPTPNIRVAAGTLQAGSSTAFSAIAPMSISTEATLALNGYSNAVSALVGQGTVTNGGAADATLTLGNNNGSTNYTFGPVNILPVQPYGILTDGNGGGILSINKVGSNVQILTGNNTFTGNVNVGEGILAVPTLTDAGVAGPLGAGQTLTLGSVLRQGGIQAFTTHNFATNRAITLAAGGVGVLDIYNATVNGAGAQTLFGDTALFSGNITGSGQLAKTSPGNAILSGTNTYTGSTNVVSGLLQFNTTGSVGGGTAANILVLKMGTVATGYAMNQAFLDRIDPNSTGVVALGANSSNNLDLTNLPNVSLGAAQNFSYMGALTVNGTYRLGGGLGAIILQNANTLTGNNALVVSPNNTYQANVVLSDAQNYTGPTTVQGSFYPAVPNGTTVTFESPATLVLAGGSAGIASTSNITINYAGTLRMVASAGDTIAGKLGSAPITMNGGNLQYYNDGSAANFAQNLGNVTLNRGQNSIYIATTSGNTSILTLASLTRTVGSNTTVDFGSTNTTTAQIIVTGGITLGEWATYGTNGFADINGSNQIVKAATTAVPAGSMTQFASSTTNYTILGGAAFTAGNGSARTIQIASGGSQATTNLALGAANTLSVNALMGFNATNTPLMLGNVTGNLAFPTGTVQPASGTDLYVYSGSTGSQITINANITLPPGGSLIRGGSPALTGSQLTLSGVNTFDNLIINYGQVIISGNVAGTLPASANIVLNGGNLQLPTITFSNPITINNDSALTTGGASFIQTGPVTLTNNAMLVFTGQGSSAFSGNISGTGGIIISNTNNGHHTFNGTGSNTFSGPFWFYGDPTGGNTNPDITLSKLNAIAIPCDIYLGWQSNLTNTGASYPRNERLILGTAGTGGDQIADSAAIYFSGGALADAGSFELNAKTETIAGVQSMMTGDGLIQNTAATASTLNLAPASGKTYAFSGTIRNGGTGTLGLVIAGTGTGTQILSSNSTYTGGTSLVSGTLGVGTDSALSTGSLSLYGGKIIASPVSGFTETLRTVPNAMTWGGDFEVGGSMNIKFTGNANMLADRVVTVSNTGTTEFAGVISGSAIGLTKNGTGVMTLSGNNSYTGSTIINAGKLVVASTGLINNSAAVTVAGGAILDYQGAANLTAPISNSGTVILDSAASVVVAGGSGYAGYQSTSNVAGLGTQLVLLDGTAGANNTIATAWRVRNSNETYPTQTYPPMPLGSKGLISDVVDFTGTSGDLYALQLSYDPSQIVPGMTENELVSAGLLYLAYNNGTSFVNAGTTFVRNGAYIPGSDLTLGNWGVDTTNHVAWAVVDHNSQWAVVPEPGTLALLAFGSMAVLNIRRKKKTA